MKLLTALLVVLLALLAVLLTVNAADANAPCVCTCTSNSFFINSFNLTSCTNCTAEYCKANSGGASALCDHATVSSYCSTSSTPWTGKYKNSTECTQLCCLSEDFEIDAEDNGYMVMANVTGAKGCGSLVSSPLSKIGAFIQIKTTTGSSFALFRDPVAKTMNVVYQDNANVGPYVATSFVCSSGDCKPGGSTGVIVGIILGLVAVVAIAVGGFFGYRYWKKRSEYQSV